MSNRKIVSWAIGVIILGTGVWCFHLTAESASFALSPGGINGMPIDRRIMAILSFGVTLFFSCLFLLSGVVNIFGYKALQVNYHPTLLNLLILCILIALSVLALSEYRATSKTTWEETRGLPFAFLTLTDFSLIEFWVRRSIDNLNFLALIIDVIIIYFVVCIGIQTLSELSTLISEKWLLKNSNEIKVNGG